MKIKYEEHKFNARSFELIEHVNAVIAEYSRQGYELTLRQTYYQLVARGFIENSEKSYKRIGDLINNARLAGLINWEAITDRTRELRGGNCNVPPAEIIKDDARFFSLDKWTNQPNYVEIWVEKDALIDVVGSACFRTDTPYFSCRGYCSQSEMWQAAQRFIRKGNREGRYLIYLGDHDPSGIDMTRDVADRLKLFGASVDVRRVALTMEQIKTFNPPPNPAKITDRRAVAYIKRWGHESWELDALEPKFITQLIQGEISALMDNAIVAKTVALEREMQQDLQLISDNYERVISYLREGISLD